MPKAGRSDQLAGLGQDLVKVIGPQREFPELGQGGLMPKQIQMIVHLCIAQEALSFV